MVDILEKAKALLQIDRGSSGAEWRIIEALIKEAPDQRQALMECIFEHSMAFTDTRARAGREAFNGDPTKGWLILERLVNSDDPDDRDAAITLLTEIGGPRAQELAKPILNDSYPYLRFEAIDFLEKVYPDKVIVALQGLLNDEGKRVREEAQKRLTELGAITDKQ